MMKVAILIPVYNTEKYIASTIASIQAQTYTDWELILLDDCSTDKTYAICQEYASTDSRIQLHRNEKNLGMMANWNKGLPLCTREYFGKLDADDLWAPTMIEKSVALLDQNPHIGLVCSDYQNMDEHGELIEGSVFNNPDLVYAPDFSTTSLVKEGPMQMFRHQILRQGIGLMRKRIFEDTGPFTLLDAGDTEMWFRIGCHYKIAFIPEILHLHRVWSQSFTRTQVLKVDKSARNLYEVRNAIFDYYFAQGKISPQEYRKFYRDNLFDWNKYNSYSQRQKKAYGAMLKTIAQSFMLDPKAFVQFYLSRLGNRLFSKEK